MISAETMPMQQRGAPAVHQPHHLVAAEAAVGAEEELAAGVEPDCGPIGLPSALTTSRSSPSTVIFSSVWVLFGPGVGDVRRPRAAPPGRRRRSGRRGRGRRARARLRTKRRRRGTRAARPRPTPPAPPGAVAGSPAGRLLGLGLDRHGSVWSCVRRPIVEFEAGQVLDERRVVDDRCRGRCRSETKVDSVRVP